MLKAKQYSPKHFGTIDSVHMFPEMQDDIHWSISALRAAEIFHFHMYWVHILCQRQIIFSEIFHFYIYWVHILHRRHNNILQDISAPTAAEIFHFHVYWVHILCSRQNNIFRTISAQTAAEMVCFHVYWVPILWPRQNNIPQRLSVLTAAEIFHFHMYWVHILSGAGQMYCRMLSSNMDQCWSFKYSHHVHNWATLCYLNIQKCIGPT